MRQQYGQSEFTESCLRPLSRAETSVQLGSEGAAVPALREGERRVHHPSAPAHGPPTETTASQSDKQQLRL